jgi:hypothetical protein
MAYIYVKPPRNSHMVQKINLDQLDVISRHEAFIVGICGGTSQFRYMKELILYVHTDSQIYIPFDIQTLAQ